MFDFLKSIDFNPSNLEKLECDSINLIYKFQSDGEDYILKLMIRKPLDDIEHHRFEKLSDYISGEKIPEVVYRDSIIRDISGNKIYAVVIMKKMKGESLNWDKVDNKSTLTEQIAQIVKYVHSIEFDQIDIIGGGKNWNEFILENAGKSVKLLVNRKQMDEQILKKGMKFIKDNYNSWKYEGRLKLIHDDLWTDNLLVNGGDLVGVIDWEWSIAGDPVYDLCGIDKEVFNNDYELIKLFYSKLDIVRDDRFNMKIRIYTIFQNLNGAAFGWLHHNPSEERFKQVESIILELVES